MSDELLKKILEYDPLDNAEHITGKSYKDDERTMAIGFLDHLRASRERTETLEMLDDTAFSNTLERYTRILTEEGFERVLEIPFAAEDGTPESFQIWFHPDGLLLDFDTFRTDSINGAKFYFNVRPKEQRSMWELRCSGSLCRSDETVFTGDFDAREALRFKIRQLRNAGRLVNPWAEQPFMWFLHYMDTKDEKYDYRAINAERMAMLPEHVREAIAA